MSRIWMAAPALLACAALAPAEDAKPPASQSGDERTLREDVNEVVDALLVMKVQERIGLSDEQFSKLVPLIKKQQRERREVESRRFHALGEMRRLFASGTATESRVVELLRDLKAAEADLPVVLRRNMDAIDALLTPLQQAKYRILDAEVGRHVRELRWRARERRHGMGPGGDRPGPSWNDADPHP
jgi:Spy/CpxP family protein refolding chaperone